MKCWSCAVATRDQTMAPTHGEDSNISNGRWSGTMEYRVIGPGGAGGAEGRVLWEVQ